jgi:4-hydroxythreonine-4-phosphate dehydrogenase
MPQPKLPRIAIALGDPAGIGPEIALKAALNPAVRAMCQPVLFGDRGVLETHARACGLAPRLQTITSASDAAGVDAGATALVERLQFKPGELKIGELAAAHGLAALDSARAAIEAALRGEVDAVVAAPMTETAIKMAGIEFDGYPSFVARCTNTPIEDAFLMICFDREGREMRIVHTTLHVSLRRAIELVTCERVLHSIHAANTALKRIGIAAPRIAVSGLNPHASEGGMFGDDERLVIEPAIADARAQGVNADGPFGADTIFHKSAFDACVVMTHDQGHVAAKALAIDRTAGLTIGTPILFSSVAHGSAYDIAGENKASPRAVIEAIRRLAGASGATQSV